jgi:branched-chain amino acid transport system permease protein
MSYLFHIATLAAIYSSLALSLDLIVGQTGLAGLGHAAFFGVGAYSSALLALNCGASPWLGVVLGGIMGAALGIVIGFPSLRLRGDYLALATLGLGIVAHSVARNWISLTRGPVGLPGIPPFRVFSAPLTEEWMYFLLALALAGITCLLFWRITSSPFGRTLRGVRDDETAMTALGRNTRVIKLTVFAVAAAIAGIAGGLYAHYMSYIAPGHFTASESILILLMVILGGMGSLRGPIIGAVVLVALPELLRLVGMPYSVSAPLRQILYGLLLIALMVWRPQGLLGKARFR